MPRPARRSTRMGRTAVLAGGVLLVLGLLKDGIWLQLLGSLILGARLTAAVLDPGRRGRLDVRLTGPSRATVGADVAQQVWVTNLGRRRRPVGALAVVTSGLSDAKVALPSLAAGATAQAMMTRRALTRGCAERHEVHVVTSDWFGLVHRHAVLDLAGPALLVHPDTLDAGLRSGAAGSGERPGVRADRAGLDVMAVREWQPGDQLRHVHWRSTARQGQIMVAARAEPADDRLCLLLASVSGARLEDDLVGRVAGAALSQLRRGRQVQLLAVQDRLASLHRARAADVLDWCARVDQPALPSPAQLAALLTRVRPGDEVRLVCDGPPPPGWWAVAQNVTARARIGLVWSR